jgi:hypothetical protein
MAVAIAQAIVCIARRRSNLIVIGPSRTRGLIQYSVSVCVSFKPKAAGYVERAKESAGRSPALLTPAMNSRRNISALQRFVGKPIALVVPRERVVHAFMRFAALHESGNGPSRRSRHPATSPPGQCGHAGLRGDQCGPSGSRLSAAGRSGHCHRFRIVAFDPNLPSSRFYSISSSAVANSVSGMVRPSALAVLAFMNILNLVGS